MLWQLCVTALLHSVIMGWNDGALKQYDKRRKCKQRENKHLFWNIFSIHCLLLKDIVAAQSLLHSNKVLSLTPPCDGAFFCGDVWELWLLPTVHRHELAGLDVKGCLSLCQIVVVQGVTHLSPCGSRDSESSIRASVFSFQTLGSSLNPKQLEFHFATVGYQSVIVKYMIYWVWEIISPSRWFLLIEILLSVSNLSIRAGSSLGGRSREGQFPVFETSNDSNNNFISKTTFIFRTITKNVPTLFVKIVKNRLCINFD